ncbi:MAG: PRC-barrel domain-containing protein [Chloroflexi bacterium]|nr:PRC-barrel domain-containing protein [Chloroflexota bacterium]
MDLRIGAAVQARDGKEVGLVRHIIVDNATSEVAGIEVLRTGGQPGSYVVPIDLIEDSTLDTVYLRASIKELQEMPATVEAYYRDLPPEWHPAPGFGAGEEGTPLSGSAKTSGTRIAENADVVCNDGKAGTVSRLLVDDYTGGITSVVVLIDRYSGKEVEIPFDWVSSIEDGRLRLECSVEALRSMPKPESEGT